MKPRALILIVLGLAVLCIGCINAPSPKLTPMPPAEPKVHVHYLLNGHGDSTLVDEWRTVAERIAQADGVTVGWIEKLETDAAYDDICGLVKVAMGRCDGTTTYSFRVAPSGKWLWAFAPSYGYLPLYVGDSAVFIWKKMPAYRYRECNQRQGMSGWCPQDLLPSVTDALDVLPIADSLRVMQLRRTP